MARRVHGALVARIAPDDPGRLPLLWYDANATTEPFSVLPPRP